MEMCYTGYMRPYGNQQHLENRRRRAIELLQSGLSMSAVAKKVGSSVSSVFLWKQMHEKDGEQGLDAKPVPGRPTKLTSVQNKKIVNHLLKGALHYGYSTDLWTTRRVAEIIEKKLGVSYHPNHIWRILTGLGWSCQKPEKRAKERNEKTIEQWKEAEWSHIKKLSKTWRPIGIP
jgi:transposase